MALSRFSQRADWALIEWIFFIRFSLKVLFPLFLMLSRSSLSAMEGCPIEKLQITWESICENESTAETRLARFVGYIEGSFGVRVPAWWRNQGLTPFSEGKPTDKSLRFGTHPTDRIISRDKVFKVVANNDSESIRVSCESPDGRKTWEHELKSLHPGVDVQGYIAIDCSLAAAGERLYILGRNGEVRFLAVMSTKTGETVGHFAFLDGDSRNLATSSRFGSER